MLYPALKIPDTQTDTKTQNLFVCRNVGLKKERGTIMFTYGFKTERAMLNAIAQKLKTAVSVVRHMLEDGNGTMSLNGFRVETFYSKETGFYFLCD